MVRLENISLSFGSRNLFKNINLTIGSNDRIGLVGVNGSGKTTLFKIICNIISPDSGRIILSRHTTSGYLPQEGLDLEGTTLFETVYNSAGDVTQIAKEISEIESEIQNYSDKDSEEYLDLIQQLSELQGRFDLLDGYKLEGKVVKVLKGLGFSEPDFDRSVKEFSEGFKMRIALAKLLIFNPSLLLLDEPTNHLDFDSLLWLEEYLKDYNGSYVIVSHEKKFLNNLVKKIYELSNGKINEYSGNYDYYEKERTIRREQLRSQLKNRQKFIKQQERFIERFRYKATKASSVQSRIKMLQKLEPINIDEEEKQINFNFPPALNSGKVILEVNNLWKSYDGENYILKEINLSISRGEKIAVLGYNGAGKSTLARIIAGKESYQKGRIEYGHNVVLQYYSQNQSEELDPEENVLETLRKASEGMNETMLRNVLGGFLFSDDDVLKSVKVLSGGEKSRLALAKILVTKSNFLILDEPTNHLDIKSKSVLKQAIKNYEGAALIVSHDRDFLKELTDKIIEVKDCRIKTYLYDIDEYSLVKREEILLKMPKKQKPEFVKKKVNENSIYLKGLEIKARKKEITKKINKLNKQLISLEEKILSLESRKKEIEILLSNEHIYKDVEHLIEIKKEFQMINKKLEKLNAEWSDNVEEIENLNKHLLKIK